MLRSLGIVTKTFKILKSSSTVSVPSRASLVIIGMPPDLRIHGCRKGVFSLVALETMSHGPGSKRFLCKQRYTCFRRVGSRDVSNVSGRGCW